MWDLQGQSIDELLVLNIEQNKQAELTNKKCPFMFSTK